MDSFMEIWQAVNEYCKKNMNETAYDLWIAPLKPIKFENNSITLTINEFKRDIIIDKFLPLLNDAFEKVLGFNITIYITIEEDLTNTVEINNPKDVQNNFDSFIVGPSNKFAYAAAKNVAANPGGVYNPLFIYGRSGLGKTHLLNAISADIIKNNTNANIICTTGENFTNELVFYIQTKNTIAFHNKYRNADALLLDDIQFIAGKIQTEEEFFHTFNALTENGKQVVLTSDRPPNEIQKLEERLRTRFEWGLLADIQPPDFETRMAIIKNKALHLNLDLSNEIVEFIADKIKNNVRQLEGAVKKLNAYCSIHNTTPSIEVATAAIKDILNFSQPISVTIEKIIEVVGKTFGVTPENIRSDKREATIVNARQVSMYVMREITDLALNEIGKMCGGKNHSTVKHSIDLVENKMNENSSFKTTVYEIIKNIQEF